MKAEDLDKKFDEEKNIIEYLDLKKARRPGLKQKRVNVDFPEWMLHSFEKEAKGLDFLLRLKFGTGIDLAGLPGGRIGPVGCDQLIVCAELHNPAGPHDINHICGHGRGQPMGNQKHRTALLGGAKRSQPFGFRPGIHGAGRLVQNQNRSRP